MYRGIRRHCIVTLTILLSIPWSNAHPGRATSSSDDLDLQESFVQYPTDGGTIIIAKPLEKPPLNNPAFEDYLHVVVACSLALLLTTLLGLFIRHYGLTLPSLTHPKRPNPNRPPAGDAENDPRPEASQVGVGFEWEERRMPEKPAAVHLKWG